MVMHAIKQVLRGCGTLPHVGEHPGTEYLIVFIVLGALTGAEEAGWLGAVGGAAFMVAFFVPIYLVGAYDRANDSDRYSKN